MGYGRSRWLGLPSGGGVPHEVVAVGGHHVGAHGLGADEVEGVGEGLADVPEVPHHLSLSLEQRSDGDAALDHCHTSVLRSGGMEEDLA